METQIWAVGVHLIAVAGLILMYKRICYFTLQFYLVWNEVASWQVLLL
jgi:hypothetical protein